MNHDIDAIMHTLRAAVKEWVRPAVTEMAVRKRDPYHVLIATIISLRTKDEITRAAVKRLFPLADTPRGMARLREDEIAEAIYPALYRHNKARTIQEISRAILETHSGRVPDSMDELLALKGVGRKTANLVLTIGYGKEGICVDTHVHRITNRWGYVSTKTPEETEFALRGKLPRKYWIEINDLLVAFGQNICKPISPLCSKCPLYDHCMRVGVGVHR